MKRRFIDDKGRLFGLISVIDVAVILIVLVLIGAVYAKFNFLDKTNTSVPTETVAYQIKINSVRAGAIESLREGDALYSSTGTDLGVITDIQTSQAERPSALTDGTMVMGTVENRFDVILTVDAPCTISDGRYFVSKTYEINVNSDHNLLTKYNTFTGTIVNIAE